MMIKYRPQKQIYKKKQKTKTKTKETKQRKEATETQTSAVYNFFNISTMNHANNNILAIISCIGYKKN